MVGGLWGVDVSDDRRCEHCGAPLGPGDGICFSCQRSTALCGALFRLGAVSFVSWIMPARWPVSALGGIAGVSAAAFNQTSGLYPHSAPGLAANWLMSLVLTSCGLAVTVWLLYRERRCWSVGSDTAKRHSLSSMLVSAGLPSGAHRV